MARNSSSNGRAGDVTGSFCQEQQIDGADILQAEIFCSQPRFGFIEEYPISGQFFGEDQGFSFARVQVEAQVIDVASSFRCLDVNPGCVLHLNSAGTRGGG